jgi:hypothetical protein
MLFTSTEPQSRRSLILLGTKTILFLFVTEGYNYFIPLICAFEVIFLRPGRESDHSLSSSTEVKNGGAVPPLPHMSSWHSA